MLGNCLEEKRKTQEGVSLNLSKARVRRQNSFTVDLVLELSGKKDGKRIRRKKLKSEVEKEKSRGDERRMRRVASQQTRYSMPT